MLLQTQVPVSPLQPELNYDSRIFLMGSCFAENMGEKFGYFAFRNLTNPFGIIFNPISVAHSFKRIATRTAFDANAIFEFNEVWQSFEVHSSLSQQSKALFLSETNQKLLEAHEFLITASHIFITLGTAWVYSFKETGAVVANCHKVAQQKFEKKLLSTEEIKDALHTILESVQHLNPEAKIIFTVSPVRHLKDGLVENNVSKAHLLSAVYQITQQHPAVTSYFPAYELVMDELRDYRFYAQDMLHPNAIAVAYIWEKVTNGLSIQTQKSMNEIDVIRRSLQHKPFNPNTAAHQKFLENLALSIKSVQETIPHFLP